jgi:hypothetical protein
MQNIDGHRRASTGDYISAYDEIVTESGIHNDVIYDESFPSTTHNNNNQGLSGKFGNKFNLCAFHTGILFLQFM